LVSYKNTNRYQLMYRSMLIECELIVC
jgi:hypothetical protein